ncbi:MAG: hypothetical protein LBV20_00900 [Treponema sp.]|jgi:hypothetical protein|nr:hypothetical protein [Treponema sp.]
MGLLNKVIAMSILDEEEEALVDQSAGLPVTHDDHDAIINNYFDASGPFNCCIFQSAEDATNSDHILQSIEMFGKLIHLQSNTFMLLFPLTIDHELLLHHLDKRFYLHVIDQFSADTAQKALSCIQNYI